MTITLLLQAVRRKPKELPSALGFTSIPHYQLIARPGGLQPTLPNNAGSR